MGFLDPELVSWMPCKAVAGGQVGGAGSLVSIHILAFGQVVFPGFPGLGAKNSASVVRCCPACGERFPRAAALSLLVDCCPVQEEERDYLLPGRVDGEKRESSTDC